jgi:hypothetical protein
MALSIANDRSVALKGVISVRLPELLTRIRLRIGCASKRTTIPDWIWLQRPEAAHFYARASWKASAEPPVFNIKMRGVIFMPR